MAAGNRIDPYRAARGNVCEVIVIGAGLVGAAAVASLVAEDLDVAVLEARSSLGVSTGSPAETAWTGFPVPYARLVEQHGREKARALWQLTVDNHASLVSAADRLGVELQRSGSLMLATTSAAADLLRTSAGLLAEDGFEVQFDAGDPLKRGFAAAIRYPDAVTVDTALLTGRLFETHGVPIHTGAEVYRLEQEGGDVLVLARGRAVKASTVVLAVNGYAALIDLYFSDKVAPVRGVTLATHPLHGIQVSSPGSAGPFGFHQTAEGGLSFTAWPEQYQTPAAGPKGQGVELELMRFIGRHFPEATDHFSRREARIAGITRDSFPIVGALPHLPQVFFAVGFAGHGLNLAFAAADLLTGLIVRGAEPPLLSARRLE